MKKNVCIAEIANKTIENITTPVALKNCDLISTLNQFNLLPSDAIKTRLGKRNEEINLWEVKIDGKKNSSLKIWGVNNKILKVDLIETFSSAEKVSKKLISFPEPIEKVDYHFGVIKMKGKALVNAEIGIAIFLGITANVVISLSYFEPTSIENYLNTLHPTNAPTEF